VLQQTGNLEEGGWTDVPTRPVVVGQENQVTLPASSEIVLFRLKK